MANLNSNSFSSSSHSLLKTTLVHTSILAALTIVFSIYKDLLNLDSNSQTSLIACYSAYFLGVYSLKKLGRYPGSKTLLNFPSIMLFIAGIIALAFTSLRLEYSRLIFTIGSIIIPIAVIVQHNLLRPLKKRNFLVIPYGCYNKLMDDTTHTYQLINTPELIEEILNTFDAIIFDRNIDLPSKWQQFLAHAASQNIPLYNINNVYESVFGKSPLDHLPEPTTSSLRPHWMYRALKRTLESLAIIGTSPAWIPLVLIFAIAIKVESKGPAFFIQKRIGQAGKEFNMIKLRSMCLDSEVNGAQFAGEDDPRITKIGKFIRKVRIDEIPQFINVLKGDMALIGPRPEQKAFVDEFEKKIPLYTLRHVVKPGITGWAQVTHGYADDEDSTKEKLAHDFYYVKNLSLWLDIVVVVKTIKTMLNGFGAR